MRNRTTIRIAAGGLAAALVLAAPAASAQGFGDTLRNLFLFNSPNEPPPAAPDEETVECPQVTIADGGAALRVFGGRGGSGSAEGLRHQISIADLARECVAQPDGSILVRVGVEGRALLGPSGAPGRFEAPVRIVLKRFDTVYANRLKRVAVNIPKGDTQASFVLIEEGLVVPPGAGEYDIEVGLGTAGPAERPARRPRR
jgi:hypothetical protein